MKIYVLMHKNIVVSLFKVFKSEVTEWIIPKSEKSANHIPLPLKRIVHYINGGYIEKENDKLYSINEEGRYHLENWLLDRAIPLNRENIKLYTQNKDTVELMLNNHSLSLTDCYWTRTLDEKDIAWDKIKLFGSKKIDNLKIINTKREKGERYSNVNSTLGGSLEKYWYYSYTDDIDKSNLMLAKRTKANSNILNIREVIANKIYKLQGYKNYCKYNYIRDRHNQIVGCKCRAFTSEQLELITAYDLLEEYGLTQVDDTYNTIIKLACNYGANEQQISTQLDIQTLVDYLITNRDRHLNNLGFLRNPDTLRIIKMAPIFDSGSSEHMEEQLPLGVDNTVVHNLYNTELECLQSVRNLKLLNLSKLPSDKWIMQELNKANINQQKYMDLYKAKVAYLKQLQQMIGD